jgi:hypothetical protein
VSRRAAWRGMLKESVCRTCEHLTVAEEACLARVPCVKGEYAPRINVISASNKNLRQIPDVKPGLEIKLVIPLLAGHRSIVSSFDNRI